MVLKDQEPEAPRKVRYSKAEKAAALRQSQLNFAHYVKEANLPLGMFPASMFPPERKESCQPQCSLPSLRKSKKNPEVAKRRSFIRKIGGVTEAKYCEMMATHYHTPASWQEWRCPASYLDSWNLTNNDLRERFLRVMRSERNNARRPKEKEVR